MFNSSSFSSSLFVFFSPVLAVVRKEAALDLKLRSLASFLSLPRDIICYIVKNVFEPLMESS